MRAELFTSRASAIVVFCLRFGPAQTASNHFPPFCRSTRRAQAPLLNLCVSQVFTENGSLGKTLFRASLSPAPETKMKYTSALHHDWVNDCIIIFK